MRHVPRVDPVITELITLVDAGGGANAIDALAEVVQNAAGNVGEAAREKTLNLVSETFRSSGGDGKQSSHPSSYDCSYIILDGTLQSVAALVASMANVWPAELLSPLVDAHLVYGTPASLLSSHTILALLDEDLTTEPGKLFTDLGDDILRSVAQKTIESAGSDRPGIARPAREARDLLKNMSHPELDGLF